ncbi:hypothetical protein [Leucobacter sp. GX24907]
MLTKTRGKAALAGLLTLGLAFTAAPAYAALGDAPSLEIDNDTFKAGSWGEGITFTVDNVPEEVDTVTISVGSMGQNGGGLVESAEITDDDGDGVFEGHLALEETTPVAPDADGYPVYSAGASYAYDDEAGETQYVFAESIDLTILEGLAVTGPEEATVAQLAEGVDLQFRGFQPDEKLTGDIEVLDPDSGEWSPVGDFAATVGGNGNGEGTLWITGATPGDQFRVSASGEEGTVHHYIRAIEGDDDGDDNTDDQDNGGEQEQPKKPERVETGR